MDSLQQRERQLNPFTDITMGINNFRRKTQINIVGFN